jgi:3-deoxy-D-manno-octulosonate 8-phosphate phosphatase (KDO 8-P phosphatase)
MRFRIDESEAAERAAAITVLLLDCDGVLTDGSILVTGDGDEIKQFDVHDGHGIVLWRRAGGRVGILSGRGSRALERRAAELQVEWLIQRSLDKLASFEAFLTKSGVDPREIAYVGDDVVDVPIMRRCALAMAPPGAVAEAIEAAGLVTDRPGGRGAVREAVEYLLKARGQWDELMKRYHA